MKGLSKSMTSRMSPEGFIAAMNFRIAWMPELNEVTPTSVRFDGGRNGRNSAWVAAVMLLRVATGSMENMFC